MPSRQAADKNGIPGSAPTRRTQERKSLSGRMGTVVVVVVVVKEVGRKEHSAGRNTQQVHILIYIPKHIRYSTLVNDRPP